MAKQPAERLIPLEAVVVPPVKVRLFATLRLDDVALVEVKSGKVFTSVVEVAVKYSATVCPTTASLAYGEVVPIPTLPLVCVVKTVVPPAWRVRMLPAPCWLSVRRVLALEAVMVLVAFVRTKSWESKPSSVSETRDAGTAPSCLRGDISPSHVGVLVPPISTPR